MGRPNVQFLQNAATIYECRACSAHLAKQDDLVSRDFKGRTGPACLFQTAINISAGPLENRMLMTGLHIIADVYCSRCHAPVGWRYDTAFEESQKYKEGKVILEVAPIRRRPAIVSGIAGHSRVSPGGRRRISLPMTAASSADEQSVADSDEEDDVFLREEGEVDGEDDGESSGEDQ